MQIYINTCVTIFFLIFTRQKCKKLSNFLRLLNRSDTFFPSCISKIIIVDSRFILIWGPQWLFSQPFWLVRKGWGSKQGAKLTIVPNSSSPIAFCLLLNVHSSFLEGCLLCVPVSIAWNEPERFIFKSNEPTGQEMGSQSKVCANLACIPHSR